MKPRLAHSSSFDKLNRLYELVEDIEVAIMTTRRPDGSLVSRPVATQRRADGADLWFVASTGSPKVAEICRDPNVNLAYYKDRSREWVSISGTARMTRDRGKIRELYEPNWKVWFPNKGDSRDGGPEDPRIGLIAVMVDSAHYMCVEKSAPVVLFEYLRSMAPGEKELGELEGVAASVAGR